MSWWLFVGSVTVGAVLGLYLAERRARLEREADATGRRPPVWLGRRWWAAWYRRGLK